MLVSVTMLGVLSVVMMTLTAGQLADFRQAELLPQLARGAGRARLLCTVPVALLGVCVWPLLRVLERLGLPVEGTAAAGTALVLQGCALLLPVVWTADGGEQRRHRAGGVERRCSGPGWTWCRLRWRCWRTSDCSSARGR
ncbi:hypothetical protein [Kitasatospora phosalacinea]|uniref:hypothetical protein n=1 Tax=Kitasatospora phosalacinea TaxID=2065 RepID=UPI000526CBA0|nr:hypothetical protein [Kitasatospora phosalacinea]